MARRGSEDPLVCRVADRGNNRAILRPRARGRDQPSTHRTADRGSDRFDPDPWDIKIRRLRQRVRNLEIQHEIKRLQKRVQDLELKREMRKAETESITVVMDEGCDGEQHPLSYYPTRFHEPIYEDLKPDQEVLQEKEPRYDEDGISPYEKECLLIRKVLNGLTVNEKEPILDELLNDNKVANGDNQIATEGVTRAKGDIDLEYIEGIENPVKVPTTMVRSLNISFINLHSIYSKIQIEVAAKMMDILHEKINFRIVNNIHGNSKINLYANINLEFVINKLVVYKTPRLAINSIDPTKNYYVGGEVGYVKKMRGRRSSAFKFKLHIKFISVFTFIKKRKSGKMNKGADGSIKVLKRLNDNFHKTRGRVFFEDRENDVGDDPRVKPEPHWDPD